ncbi:hypothetical protein [Aurantiacibacter odishensis]|uniref:hypothetical protein n=1 Tax=Aurantiacibacter odishensis TaxID=1155476 RepID=UPI000E714A9D|nr:hypothetical protein [Aurantiacibacter odishensis]
MRACLSLLPISLALIGCAPGAAEDGEVAEDAALRTTTHIIPREFRGRWAEVPAACLVPSSRRYEIAAGRIDTASFGGEVESVEVGEEGAVARLALDQGEVPFSMTLVDTNTMQASYGDRSPFILRMCR